MILESLCTRLRALGAAALLAALPEAAAAQAAAQDTLPTFDLDSVVVSVAGTPIRLGASPFPISVIGKSDLRTGRTGMFLEEALQSLPGVQVQNRFNYAVGERVTIRGFGARAQFGVRGIHVVVDGIPATLPDGQSTLDHLDIGSLGRVEALRGPASAIYGNASGGVLRFETELPTATSLREEATVVAGSHGLFRMQSTTSGTVGSTGYVVSLNRLSYDGFRYFGTGTTRGDSYGSAERMHVNTRLAQRLAGGELGITLNHLDLDSENPGSITRAQFNEDPRQIAAIYNTFRTGKEVQQGQLGVRWTGPVGSYTTEAAVYGLTRDFSNPLPNDVVDLDRRAAGARLTVGRSTALERTELALLAGLEYDLQDDDRREYSNSGGRPDQLRLNQTENVKSMGSFLQASLTFRERLTMVGGIRYDHSRFEVDDLFPVTPGVNEDASGRRDMNKWSPTVGVHVQVVPALGLFANYATSFETPTTVELGNRETGSGGFNPDLDPMTGRTFEAGARGAVADRVTFEVSGFLTKLENELIPYENVDRLTYYRNAGETERLGTDAILRVRFLDFVAGQVSYTYTKATFEKYVDRSGNDFSGKRVPGLADHQLQGTLSVSRGPWYVDFDVEYTGEVAVNDRNCLVPLVGGACPAGQDDGFTDAYTLVGVRAGGVGARLGRVEISPFAGVQNLFDKKYVASVVPNAFGSRFYEPGPGRTFYLGGTLAVSR
jgi:iron complex outermembrane receptor protein